MRQRLDVIDRIQEQESLCVQDENILGWEIHVLEQVSDDFLYFWVN